MPLLGESKLPHTKFGEFRAGTLKTPKFPKDYRLA